MKITFARFTASALMAGIIGLSSMLTSCSEMNTSPVTQSTSLSDASGLKSILTADDLGNYVADNGTFSYESVLLDEQMGGGMGDPNRDTIRKDGPGKGNPRLRPMPLPCLKLTPEQMTAVRQLMRSTDSANRLINAQFRAEMEALRKREMEANAGLRAQMDELNKQLRTLTEKYRQDMKVIMDDASLDATAKREAVKALRTEFEAATKDLRAQMAELRKQMAASVDTAARKALQERLQAALKANQDKLYADIYGLLDDAQKAIWDKWLAGEDPCKGIIRRG